MKLRSLLMLTLAVGTLSVMSGCKDILEELEDDGSNETTLSVSGDTQHFEIIMKVGDVGGDYYHVKYELQDSSGSRKLYAGSNYDGTVKTVCDLSAMNGNNTNSYSCVTSYDTDSPVGDPADETKSVDLQIGDEYTVKMYEVQFGDDRITNVGSFTVQ